MHLQWCWLRAGSAQAAASAQAPAGLWLAACSRHCNARLQHRGAALCRRRTAGGAVRHDPPRRCSCCCLMGRLQWLGTLLAECQESPQRSAALPARCSCTGRRDPAAATSTGCWHEHCRSCLPGIRKQASLSSLQLSHPSGVADAFCWLRRQTDKPLRPTDRSDRQAASAHPEVGGRISRELQLLLLHRDVEDDLRAAQHSSVD